MIAFVYPNHDYTAAELAIKAQALAGSKGMKVYSPPRNYMMTAYRWMEVKDKLSRSKAALFLAHDVQEIDEICKKELDVLRMRSVPVYFLVTANMKRIVQGLGFDADNVFTYNPSRPKGLYGSLKTIVDRATETASIKPADRRNAGSNDIVSLLVIVGLIMLLIIILEGGGGRK